MTANIYIPRAIAMVTPDRVRRHLLDSGFTVTPGGLTNQKGILYQQGKVSYTLRSHHLEKYAVNQRGNLNLRWRIPYKELTFLNGKLTIKL